MKKLFFKLGLLFLLVTGGLALLFFFFPRPAHDPIYEAAILDKHRSLATVTPPRIIFIGGSGLAFGLDSAFIEKELGVRVINMGLHAGLGLRFMASEVKPFMGKGDVVVVVPEYEQFFGDALDGGFDLAFVAMRFPDVRQYLTSWKQYAAIIRNAPYALRASLYNMLSGQRFSTSFAYCRAAFNVQGDSLGHLDKMVPSAPMKCGGIDSPFNGEAISVLNDLQRFAHERGAKVLFIYPAIEERQYKASVSAIGMFADALKTGSTIPVFGDPAEFSFAQDHFYDSVYHLNRLGRQKRTEKVVARLKQALSATVERDAL